MGDGLPDIVDSAGGTWKIWLNTGSNFIDGGDWPTEYSGLITDLDTTGNVKRDLIDINGDGLPDIVNPPTGSSSWEIQFNTGKGFTEKIFWAAPSEVPADGYTRDAALPDSNGDTHIRRDLFDINGDGLIDIVRKNSNNWQVYPNNSGQADLLMKITDTLGGIISVSYSPSMDYVNTRLPYNYWVVSQMNTDNGMVDAHAVSSVTSFSYAKGSYDFPTREFRGFGEVTETRADGTKVLHSYHQDEAKKGKEYRTEIKNSSEAPFTKTENNWSESSANDIYISNLSGQDEYTYDGDQSSSPKIVSKEYQNYDPYGNIGIEINFGDLDVIGDEVYIYNEYWPPCDTGPWIADKIRHIYVAASEGGAILRESFFLYDDLSTCVEKGNLTREERWLDTGANPVTSHQYDAYGNRIRTVDSEGRVTQIEYDSEYNAFPELIRNPKNQATVRSHNPG